MTATSHKTMFAGSQGHQLAARLDLPVTRPRAYALFAHCFTCTKDILAARNIALALSRLGIGVMRFDFTGLGSSEGEFANTHFSSNVEDLVHAADFMRVCHGAPALLVGHSLGGAAVLAAAHRIPECKAVVTIGAPADVAHVLHNFGSDLTKIQDVGEADVTLAGRAFRIRRTFVEDAREQMLTDHVAKLRRALLVLHSPIDQVVGVENAATIFTAAKHPKSYVSLDDADHLLSTREDAEYAAGVIAAWAERYLPPPDEEPASHEVVTVTETRDGKFQNIVVAGQHHLLADEPEKVGGLDTGPSPYDYLSIALGACTSMTLRMYAEHKKIDLGRVSVTVRHGKVPVDHCEDCGEAAQGREGRIDRFERIISIEGGTPPELADKIIEIAGKCPVHRTLEAGSAVVTVLADTAD